MTARKKTKPRKKGAPTIKTKALCGKICEGIALGKSARAMCIELKISQRVLWNWLATDEEFMQQYARAKEKCADHYAEEIIEISDDGSKDTYIDEKGREVTDQEVVARARLRVDARKWYASKLAPKKYGDRITNEHEGGDPSKPINHNIQVSFVAANAPK
jgi:hypothetical protein